MTKIKKCSIYMLRGLEAETLLGQKVPFMKNRPLLNICSSITPLKL